MTLGDARDGLVARFSGRLGRFSLDATIAAPARGVTALFGPSGCGKTTMLRAVAGLTRLAEGYCALDGDVWQDGARFTPTFRRPIGYVFQEPSLFPHLSARGNLTFGAPKGDLRFFDEIVALLGLAPLLGRAPATLSGGERQRVALGRAVLSRPRLLLMDEPLSALDADAKAQILPFLERLGESLDVPSLYVSHDMSEIERLADHLVLMGEGRTIACGPLHMVQSDPALPLAARRDAAVTLAAQVTQDDAGDGLMAVEAGGAQFLAPRSGAGRGATLRLRIGAGDVSLALERPAGVTILNAPAARILSASAISEAEMLVVLALGEEGAGGRLLARVTRRSWATLGLTVGQAVFAQVKGVALARRAPASLKS